MKKVIKYFFSFILIGLISLLFFSYLNSMAYEDNYFNSKTFYSQTNTYNYLYDTTVPDGTDIEDGIDVSFNNEARYDMSKQNDNVVSNNMAQITVFTHGWNGNESSFGYGENSLITKLARLQNANIYIFGFEEKTDYVNTHKLFLKKVNSDIYDANNSSLVDDVDPSKPIILVFKGCETGLRNDFIYTQFNYALSRVVYSVKNANGGVLPKINLIGHSRGGLTNMQYALDHPQMIQSMYSFGTPYLGTSLAELDVNKCGCDFIKIFMPDSVSGEQDLADSNVYLKYYNRWNENYDSLYSHINVMALGVVTSIGYINDFLNGQIDQFLMPLKNYFIDKCGQNTGELLYSNFKVICLSLFSYVGVKSVTIPMSVFTIKIVSSFSNLVNKILTPLVPAENREVLAVVGNLNNLIEGIAKIICNEVSLFKSESIVTWNSDIAVNLESQMGKRIVDGKERNYKGFKRHYVEFTSKDISPDNITHVKEMFHYELQGYLLSDIKVNSSNGKWQYKFLDNDSISIDGYNGKYNDSNLIIPEYVAINGKNYTVKAIGDYAFANNGYGSTFSKIYIPSTVESIGNYAFANSTTLNEVDLSNDSALVSIGNGCFMMPIDNENDGISLLKLPQNLRTIGINAFANNKKLTSIVLPYNIMSIGEGALSGTSINSLSSTAKYSWSNNVLVDKSSNNGKYEVVFANPSISEITIPDNVISISAAAFKIIKI